MGVVDLAVAPDGTEVALKKLSLHGSATEMEAARRRIRREAEILSHLDAPHLARLLEVLDDDGDLVLVMPYLAGGSLSDRVSAAGPLPPADVERLLISLLTGLAAAHRQGVIHRDIKPSNVLFDSTGEPHLVDFGVAWSSDATVGLTSTDVVVGTPAFMAPEQARGEPATPASDVFSLAATMAWAATGRGPYGDGDPRLLISRAAQGKVQSLPSSLPRTLRRRLGPLLDRDPAQRPSAAEVLGGPAGTWPRKPGASGRRTRAVTAAVATAVVIAGVGVFGVLASSDGTPAVPDGAPVLEEVADPSTTGCDPLPYQPCGQDPAPNTDGEACTGGAADYDGDPVNGCEAEPDDLDGTVIDDEVEANLVPADDTDSYSITVEDDLDVFCDGVLYVELTSPPATTQRIEVWMDDELLAAGTSDDGEPVELAVEEPTCMFGDDGGRVELWITSVGQARSAEDYRVEVSGGW
ncbi:MAG: Serine/threonine-protein kinase PknD [Acidimicrobiales bacterium]|nr:MAG: serine/threonine protein kinase [Actinomycetota bacterium]MBV6510033.1 Serine/threonine-protein kinase PknD [Acidimicrobiales bacterium]RIK08378.1 MAG: hypothetical protein DCC48_00015 [Acidobacteriota bacterium]